MRRPLTLALLALALLTTAPPARAEAFDPYAGPKPIAVFVQTNPWAMVIGSDTPRVAVYDDGQVIFPRRVGNRLVYHTVTLDKAGLDKVRDRLKPVLALKDLKSGYNVRPNATDQPEAKFYLRDGDRTGATSVYGLMAPGTRNAAETVFPNGPKPTPPPDELLALHKWLCELDYPDAKEWTPRYFEVMFWDYAHAPDASIQWPKDWPGLTSERAVKRGGEGDMYSVYVDAALLPKLREFLTTLKPRGAVEIDGRKMAASVRHTFPGEPIWRKAFEAEPADQ